MLAALIKGSKTGQLVGAFKYVSLFDLSVVRYAAASDLKEGFCLSGYIELEMVTVLFSLFISHYACS